MLSSAYGATGRTRWGAHGALLIGRGEAPARASGSSRKAIGARATRLTTTMTSQSPCLAVECWRQAAHPVTLNGDGRAAFARAPRVRLARCAQRAGLADASLQHTLNVAPSDHPGTPPGPHVLGPHRLCIRRTSASARSTHVSSCSPLRCAAGAMSTGARTSTARVTLACEYAHDLRSFLGWAGTPGRPKRAISLLK